MDAKEFTRFRIDTAAKVLAGLMANPAYSGNSYEHIVNTAVILTDKLIKALEI